MVKALEFLTLSVLCGTGVYFYVTWPAWMRELEARCWDSLSIAKTMRGIYIVGWGVGCVVFAWSAIATGGRG